MFHKGLKGDDGHGPQVAGHEGGDTVEEPPDLTEGVTPPGGDQVLPGLPEGDKHQGTLWNPTLELEEDIHEGRDTI